jgi:hypothetical protein
MLPQAALEQQRDAPWRTNWLVHDLTVFRHDRGVGVDGREAGVLAPC